MNLQENIPIKLRRRAHSLDKVINNLLLNMYPCDYNSSDHFVEGVLDEIRWFLLDFEELQVIERIDIENYILDHKYDELTNYFNERCIGLKNDYIQESIKKILREDMNIPTYIKRRLYVVDEYISNLDPEDVCIHWPRDEVNEYVSGFMAEIVRVILDDMPDLDPNEFGEMFDEIYGILINLGYRKKIRDFFYESLQNCDPKHRMRFARP